MKNLPLDKINRNQIEAEILASLGLGGYQIIDEFRGRKWDD